MSLPRSLHQALFATQLRLRVDRGLRYAGKMGLVGVASAAGIMAAERTGMLHASAAGWGLALAALLPVVGLGLSALRPLARLTAARALDRAHGLHDRVSNALDFAQRPEKSAWMRAAIRDAEAHSATLDPRQAAPLSVPRALWVSAALAAALLPLGLAARPAAPPPTAQARAGMALAADDLDAFREQVASVLGAPALDERPTDEVHRAAEDFNRLIEALSDRALTRSEALRQLSALDAAWNDRGAELEASAMRDGLRRLGRDLERARLSRPVAEALLEEDPGGAEEALRRLAELLRQGNASRAELRRLRAALQRAAEREREAEAQRQARERRLLSRRAKKAATERADKRLLRRRQRELERLRREHQAAMAERRQLERLRRELSRAAEDLSRRETEDAARRLEQGAADLNRMAREQRSREEMQRLRQQLAQLRELIRRMREPGEGEDSRPGGERGRRMRRFVLGAKGQPIRVATAGGQGSQGQGAQGQGAQGQGSQGQGAQGQGAQGQGAQGQGAQGQGAQGQGAQGQGSQGQGSQGQGAQGQGAQGQGAQGQGAAGRGDSDAPPVLTLGGGGPPDAVLEIPGMGASQAGGRGSGARVQDSGGAGSEHDPTAADRAAARVGDHRTVRVEGDRSRGPTRSQIIAGAAQRGFANRRYRGVYSDYSGHAEAVLERDEVPPGFRFYVRRYFQLIRPRE